MTIQDQIEAYIVSQPEPKRADLRGLHQAIQQTMADCRLWFLDGRDETGKVVSNPNIGYGLRTIQYADGKAKEFYQIGLSANTSGISVYILGIEDKTYLARTYGQRLGKASVTGYCLKFRKLADIDLAVLTEAVRDGVTKTRPS
jgi:hypothetical protein